MNGFIGLIVLLLASVALGAPTHSIELRAAGPNKILVIKLVREITGMPLKEAKDLVESAPALVLVRAEPVAAEAIAARLREVGATAVVIGPGLTVEPAPPPEVRSSVTLLTPGPNKLEMIKLVREITGLGLAEAKYLLEKTPAVLKSGLGKADTEELVKRIQLAGGTTKVTADAP